MNQQSQAKTIWLRAKPDTRMSPPLAAAAGWSLFSRLPDELWAERDNLAVAMVGGIPFLRAWELGRLTTGEVLVASEKLPRQYLLVAAESVFEEPPTEEDVKALLNEEREWAQDVMLNRLSSQAAEIMARIDRLDSLEKRLNALLGTLEVSTNGKPEVRVQEAVYDNKDFSS